MDKPQIIAHVQKPMNFTLFDCRWIPCSAKFVVLGNHARGTGALQVWEVSHGDVSLVHEVHITEQHEILIILFLKCVKIALWCHISSIIYLFIHLGCLRTGTDISGIDQASSFHLTHISLSFTVISFTPIFMLFDL